MRSPLVGYRLISWRLSLSVVVVRIEEVVAMYPVADEFKRITGKCVLFMLIETLLL